VFVFLEHLHPHIHKMERANDILVIKYATQKIRRISVDRYNKIEPYLKKKSN